MSGHNDGSRFGIDDNTSKSDNNNNNNNDRFDSFIVCGKEDGDSYSSRGRRGRGGGRGGNRGRYRGGRGDGNYQHEGEHNNNGDFGANDEGHGQQRRGRGGRYNRGGYDSNVNQNNEEGGERNDNTFNTRGRGRGRGRGANNDFNNNNNNNAYGGYDNTNEDQYQKSDRGGRGGRRFGGERGSNRNQRTSRGGGGGESYHNDPHKDPDYSRKPQPYEPTSHRGEAIEERNVPPSSQANEDHQGLSSQAIECTEGDEKRNRSKEHNDNNDDRETYVRRGRGRGNGDNNDQGSRGGGRGGRSAPQFDQTLSKPGRTQRAPRLRHNNFDEAEVETLFKSHHNQSGISFDNYNSIEVQIYPQDIPPVSSFEELKVEPHLAANIARCGYKNPTPVQKYAISIALSGGDIMACAQTGSGKTAAFVIPVIQHLLVHGVSPAYEHVSCPVGLILAPTRELALQIFDDVKKMAFKTDIFADVSYGGKNYPHHFENDVLVACPGRLKDLFDREKVSFQCVKYLILDEADRMLEMGFEEQIRYLCGSQFSDMPPPNERQTLMFSATFPEAIRLLGQRYLRDRHYLLTVGRVGSTTKNITQRVRRVERSEKREALLDIICEQLQEDLVLVFVETKREADDLWYFLDEEGIPCNAIHGDREQWEREEALKKFKNGTCPILIATDVASRGLDIPNVTHVIQYDLPKSMDDYTHRIGRTGRAGNKGVATSFFSSSNANIAAELMSYLAEHQQEVPAWMEDIADEESARRHVRSRGGGRRGGGGRRVDDAPDSWEDSRGGGRDTGRGGGGGGNSSTGANNTGPQRQQPKRLYDDGGF